MTQKHTDETEQRTEQLRLTDEGLVMPDELVGFTGTMVVEWPSDVLANMKLGISEPGMPEVCDYICRGNMPSEADANGVPGGHLRINDVLYEIEDARSVEADS